MPSYYDNPQYQRAMQKLKSLDSTQRAILSSVGADEMFASAEMRKKVASMNAALNRKAQDKRSDLASRSLAQNYDVGKRRLGLAQRQFENYQDALPVAEGLGLANVVGSGLLGYGQYKNQLAREKMYYDMLGGIR